MISNLKLTKLLYACNAVFQFLMVKWMLGAPDPFWGWTVLNDLIAGREWPESGNFPRVTICDFSASTNGNPFAYDSFPGSRAWQLASALRAVRADDQVRLAI